MSNEAGGIEPTTLMSLSNTSFADNRVAVSLVISPRMSSILGIVACTEIRPKTRSTKQCRTTYPKVTEAAAQLPDVHLERVVGSASSDLGCERPGIHIGMGKGSTNSAGNSIATSKSIRYTRGRETGIVIVRMDSGCHCTRKLSRKAS